MVMTLMKWQGFTTVIILMDWGQVTNMCAGNKFTNVWPGMPPWTIRPISRKASDKYNVSFCSRNIHICAHFWGKMVHYGIFLWCIIGFVRLVFHIYAQYHTAQATDSWNGGWLSVTLNSSWCMGIKGDMFINHKMTSSNWNIFRVTGLLCGHRWIPHAKASDADLWCFLWSAPE